MGMYRARWQGTISPQKSKECRSSKDKWPRTTLLSSLSACTLVSSNSSFCQAPFPPLPSTHTHLTLLSSLSLCLGLPHLKQVPRLKLFNPYDCQHSHTRTIVYLLLSKSKTKGHREKYLVKATKFQSSSGKTRFVPIPEPSVPWQRRIFMNVIWSPYKEVADMFENKFKKYS